LAVSGFPLACPCRSHRNPVSSSRRIARSMRICRTTRSCITSRQGLWGRLSWKGGPAMVSGPRDTPRRVRASHTATLCSTASNQNRDADWPAPHGAESSFRPSRECTRSSGSTLHVGQTTLTADGAVAHARMPLRTPRGNNETIAGNCPGIGERSLRREAITPTGWSHRTLDSGPAIAAHAADTVNVK